MPKWFKIDMTKYVPREQFEKDLGITNDTFRDWKRKGRFKEKYFPQIFKSLVVVDSFTPPRGYENPYLSHTLK